MSHFHDILFLFPFENLVWFGYLQQRSVILSEKDSVKSVLDRFFRFHL